VFIHSVRNAHDVVGGAGVEDGGEVGAEVHGVEDEIDVGVGMM
jgi:hypothetical protein